GVWPGRTIGTGTVSAEGRTRSLSLRVGVSFLPCFLAQWVAPAPVMYRGVERVPCGVPGVWHALGLVQQPRRLQALVRGPRLDLGGRAKVGGLVEGRQLAGAVAGDLPGLGGGRPRRSAAGDQCLDGQGPGHGRGSVEVHKAPHYVDGGLVVALEDPGLPAFPQQADSGGWPWVDSDDTRLRHTFPHCRFRDRGVPATILEIRVTRMGGRGSTTRLPV